MDTELENKINFNFVKNCLKSWNNLLTSNLKLTRLTGLTNIVYKLSHDKEDVFPKSIIYRIFGDCEFISRVEENTIFEFLSKENLGPKLYGSSKGCRLEEYIEKKHPSFEDVCTRRFKISLAKYLTVFTSVRPENIDKTPKILNSLQKDGKIIGNIKSKLLKEELFMSKKDKEMVEKIKILISDDEINFLLKILPKRENSICFTHNDIFPCNIFVVEENSKYLREITLIDYEYGGYNYIGNEFGNFFNECSFDYEYKESPFFSFNIEKLPNKSDLEEFSEYFLFFKLLKENKFENSNLINLNEISKDRSVLIDFIKKNVNYNLFIEERNNLVKEIIIGQILAHYNWALWGILQFRETEIKFGYCEFCLIRIDLYNENKKKYLEEIL